MDMRTYAVLLCVVNALWGALASDSCPLDLYSCGVTNETILTPSWCSYRNPFIVAQPPTRLSNASTDLSTYTKLYRCNDPDPFSLCQSIDNFVAAEVAVYPNTSVRLIVIAHRLSDDVLANSTLSIFDSHFNDLSTPISVFPGRLSILNTMANPLTGGNTTLIAYGGLMHYNYYAPDQHGGCGFGCVYVLFIEMDLVQPHGIQNNTAAFIPSGGFFETRTYAAHTPYKNAERAFADCSLAAARADAILLFTVQIPLVLFALGEHLAMAYPKIMTSKWSYPDAVNVPFAAMLLYNSNATAEFFGWSVQVFMHFPPNSPYCYEYDWQSTFPCFLPVQRVRIMRDSQQIPFNESLNLKISETFSNCSIPNGTAVLGYAYSPFYTSQNCVPTTLLWISSKHNISVYAFSLNLTLIDLSTDSFSQAFSLPRVKLSNTSEITDFVPFTEVVLRDPYASATPPSAVWTAVATRDVASGAGALYVARYPQFSNSVNGSFPPFVVPSSQNPAGSIAPCSWMTFWNGTTCEEVPYHLADHGVGEYATSLLVRWRALPDDKVALLLQTGCLPWNLTCFETAINSSTYQQSLMAPASPIRVSSTARFAARNALAAMQHQWELGTPADELARDLVTSMYGNRFILFAPLSEPQVGVLELVPVGCDSFPLQLTTSVANVLSMMGPVRTLSVTNNAQYAFGSVSRPQYFLHSMERAVVVCDDLSHDPTDPFLAPFADSCQQQPRLPAVSDFLQVAGVCLPGVLCPSFDAEIIDVMAAGAYTTFGFDETDCEPGYICNSGRKEQCPTGFMCPFSGMSLPMPCTADESLNATCYNAGLAKPMVCPVGTICGTPYLPAIPAPPAYAQSYAQGIRTLVRCNAGTWCGLGRSLLGGESALACPGGTYCTSPDVVEPTVCDLNGLCNASFCPKIPYCPAGSTTQELCPQGTFCSNVTTSTPCSAGTFCPSGTPLWQLCAAASYCPNASMELQCPNGAYCPQGSSEPVVCSHMSHCYCDGGCAEPPFSVVIAVFAMLVFAAAALFIVWRFWLRPWLAKQKARARQQRKDKRLRPRSTRASAGVEMSDSHRALLDASQVVDAEAGSINMPVKRRSARPTSLRLSRKNFTVDIGFENLGLTLRKGGKSVLDGVTGQLSHGRVCAVMGPSGAGKTTFLTALCGKASYGKLGGRITINGNDALLTDSKYRHLVGFVPQEDIMMRDLTVEENIVFSAQTRLPASWPQDMKLAFADSVIDLLGLADIRDSVIGDEAVRGISGGQRKRVNIGIELAADPTVLFLDEPTSGLDATSSMEVCSALRRIADLGLTVALVLHQPRWEIFTSFDDLLLLGKGGKTVYIGPVADALKHFEHSLSISCPDRVNPADFLLDVVGGDVPKEWAATHPDFHPSDLVQLWTDNAPVTLHCFDLHPNKDKPPPHFRPVSWFWIFWQCLMRSLVQQARHPWIVVLDNVLVFISAFFLALVYFGTPSYGAPEPIEVFQGCSPQIAQACQTCLAESSDSILNRGVMTIISISLTGVATFLRVFGSERTVYFREASSIPQPKHTSAYFLGKDLSMLPQLLIGPLIFTMAFEILTTPRAAFGDYYLVFLGVYWCASAFGYLTSVLAPASLSQLLGVVAIFSNAMFAGGQPTLKQMLAKFAPLCYMPFISYMRYALEALYVNEVSHYGTVVELQGLNLEELVSDTFGYDLSAASLDITAIFAIGLLVRACALSAMLLKDRNKKK